MALQPLVRPRPLFQFLNRIHSRQDSLDGDQLSQGRYYLYTGKHTDIHASSEIRTQSKTVHALDRAAAVIGAFVTYLTILS
jgi:hypothetical protein